jgi:hypothetical protein
MRLNGWQRIGIALSLPWIVVGTLWESGASIEKSTSLSKLVYSVCSEDHPFSNTCAADFSHNYARDLELSNHWADGVAFGVVPVIMAWVAVYALLWIARWVRAGF